MFDYETIDFPDRMRYGMFTDIGIFDTSLGLYLIFSYISSLGMKDSWGPLKALAAASAVNGFGDIVLCSFLGYGIAGAAWATMASQVC